MGIQNGINDISAKKFVDRLLDEGEKTPCDDSNEIFNKQGETVPDYFDKELFERGQKLYFKHQYALDLLQSLGIIIFYSVPTALNIVVSAAGESATVYDAYCRQMRTNLYLHSFYSSNFDKGSSDWKKISNTKKMHSTVSKGSMKQGLNPLTQKDMALGQFVMFGLCLVRGEMAGLHGVTKEEWKGFQHFWRVIGHLIGMSERFNICSVPLHKTAEISELIIERVLIPSMDKKNPKYMEIAKLFLTCWRPILPDLEPNVAMNYAYNLIKGKSKKHIPELTFVKLNSFLKFYYQYFAFTVTYLMQWDIYRILRNAFHNVNLYLITNFTFIPKIQCNVYEYLNTC